MKIVRIFILIIVIIIIKVMSGTTIISIDSTRDNECIYSIIVVVSNCFYQSISSNLISIFIIKEMCLCLTISLSLSIYLCLSFSFSYHMGCPLMPCIYYCPHYYFYFFFTVVLLSQRLPGQKETR